MRSTFLARTRKWIGASALAILVGLGGGSAFFAASSQMATAQVTPAAQITAPAVSVQSGFADLVDAVKPAVVSIVVEGRDQSDQFPDMGGQFNQQIPDLPEDNPLKKFFDQFGKGGGDNPQKPQRPMGRKFVAAGSGFAISADGYIVTNNHVVRNASKVTVVLDNGDEMTATVVGTDERTDLAVVKVDGVTDMPFVKFATSDARVGDWVVAVGNPFGLGGTVTAGIVSALGRDVGGSAYGNFIQIDAAINMGNSGGPAFNLQGEVVGVNTEIFSPNGGNVGIAFAIPAKTVEQITASLIQSGTVTRGFLGVSIQDVNRDIADSVGLKDAKGALVTQLTDDSPGGKAGLKSGDIITAVDGQGIDDALGLSRTIASKAPGTNVELTVWRDGAEIKIAATLGTLTEAQPTPPTPPAPPVDQPAAPVPSSVGVTLVPNAGGEGLLIQDIDPDSVAADKGFAVGDLILEVDNKAVTTATEFENAIKAVKESGRGTALIKAERSGAVRFIGLPLTKSQG
ncbi:MAG: Do family serine endopeptidase [Devosia nanyangense]|uniref:Probable periplasmic serine endoprotease DegP-like n=1 Tax=Devosia nanyangense TaxID=1228055 RepID=A0A933NYY6_9HYPH|nr:Do family serine endopeptidase [Devosia nanyangense]